eukprot:SAG31_NODE_2720_length_5190_cov_3.678256_1_plen_311_part_00
MLYCIHGDTFSISALHLSIKVPYFSHSGHKNEKVTPYLVCGHRSPVPRVVHERIEHFAGSHRSMGRKQQHVRIVCARRARRKNGPTSRHPRHSAPREQLWRGCQRHPTLARALHYLAPTTVRGVEGDGAPAARSTCQCSTMPPYNFQHFRCPCFERFGTPPSPAISNTFGVPVLDYLGRRRASRQRAPIRRIARGEEAHALGAGCSLRALGVPEAKARGDRRVERVATCAASGSGRRSVAVFFARAGCVGGPLLQRGVFRTELQRAHAGGRGQHLGGGDHAKAAAQLRARRPALQVCEPRTESQAAFQMC